LILIFDTSTAHLAIGLASDEGTLLREFHAEAAGDERGIHDARLASETEKLLHIAQVKASEISRVGLIIGPGSFTGLRIGLSFAKGLSLATGAGIVALTQHEIMKAAASIPGDYIITPGYRPDLLYFAEGESPRHIQLLRTEDFLKLPQKSTLAHPLFQSMATTIPAEYPRIFIPMSLTVMARLITRSVEVLEGDSLDTVEPLYITSFLPDSARQHGMT
jgi:tRNA threonylcarbamoyl adenosine modification protein YeaZ